MELLNSLNESAWSFMNTVYAKLMFSNTKRLKKLKNKHLGERCFIVGNGPSLNFADLEKLKSEKTMVANSIIQTFSDLSYIPNYYFCQDLQVLKDNIAQINAQKGITKIIRAYYNKNYHVKDANYFYLHENNTKFSADITKGVYCGWTVVYSMMQFAVYMGFKEIYLIGVDFNYAKNNTEINEACYFDKRLFNKNTNYALPKVEYTLDAFRVARKYVEENNIKIYNATRGGKLEVFERIDFDSIL